jgi:hypothetical protein
MLGFRIIDAIKTTGYGGLLSARDKARMKEQRRLSWPSLATCAGI